MKVFAKVIKIVLIVSVFLVIGFLLWRIWFFDNDRRLDTMIPTDAARAEYARGGDAVFLTNPVHDKISSSNGAGDGYFAAYGFVYIPDKKEVQVTVRMNDSTMEKLGLDGVPYFFLKIYTNFNYGDDESGAKICECARYEDDHNMMYTYRRLVFEDVEIGEANDLLVCLSADGTSAGGVSELVVHFREQPLEEYTLTDADKRALSP